MDHQFICAISLFWVESKERTVYESYIASKGRCVYWNNSSYSFPVTSAVKNLILSAISPLIAPFAGPRTWKVSWKGKGILYGS